MRNQYLYLLQTDPSSDLGQYEQGAGGNTQTETTGTPSTAGQPEEQSGGLFGSMWIWVLWAAVLIGMYFLMMRPQRKREKQMKEMQSNIRSGDSIVTSGGLFGNVVEVGEDCFIIEFGLNRGVRVPVQKSDVIGIKSPKTTPPPKEAIEDKEKKT